MARTVPSEATRAVGDGLTAAYVNANVRDSINFLLTKPIARLHQAVGQGITNAVWTAITFDSTDWDSDNGHSNAVNNTRYTCQVQGYYRVDFTVGFGSNTVPLASIAKNGTRIGGSGQAGGGNATAPWGTAGSGDQVHLNVGDYIEGFVFQSSGGSLTTSVTGENVPKLLVEWLYSG